MRIVLAAVFGLLVVGSSAVLVGCQGKEMPESNQTLTMDELPPKVQAAMKREADLPVESINRHEKKGNVVYGATVQSEGKKWDIELDEEGRLLRRSQRPTN